MMATNTQTCLLHVKEEFTEEIKEETCMLHVKEEETGMLHVKEEETCMLHVEEETRMVSNVNSVDSLLKSPFERLTRSEQLLIKHLGPDQPDILIRQASKERGKPYTRSFSRSWFDKTTWLCGCPTRNRVFCFPCLLFRNTNGHQGDILWTKTGMSDLKHFAERVRKHENSRSHLESALKLAMLGKANIATQPNEACRSSTLKHNQEVEKNRHILSKLIDCVKFCGAFELALRGHDQTPKSENPGVFLGLVDFVASIDSAMKQHLDTAAVFKGTSKTVQNELLDCMLSIMQGHILQDLQTSDFVSIQADETTDVTTHCQLVIVYRYIDAANTVQERFFSFINLEGGANADTVSKVLLENLGLVFHGNTSDKVKLIAQTYDGASVMCGSTGGVRRIIQEEYSNAHFLHCYAHQPNLVMQKAASTVKPARVLFSDLDGFSTFFTRSHKRTDVLQNTAAQRQPRASQTRLNFQSRVVNTVFENKNQLLECFQTIQASDEFDNTTIREATGFMRMLVNNEFLFFLELFHKILPRVDILFAHLQKRDIDALQAHHAVNAFTGAMSTIRDSVPLLSAKYTESGISDRDRQRSAYEVCDTIIQNAKDRFTFTKHLIADTLVLSERFQDYCRYFPTDALKATVEAYPMLNMPRLKTELSLIYDCQDFRQCKGAMALFKFILDNKLLEVCSETLKLLRILITIPMTTAEPERCFSTLKRIKDFLRNTMSQERLNALAMLSIEKRLTREIPDFNGKVIEKFANLKNRRAKFLYK